MPEMQEEEKPNDPTIEELHSENIASSKNEMLRMQLPCNRS